MSDPVDPPEGGDGGRFKGKGFPIKPCREAARPSRVGMAGRIEMNEVLLVLRDLSSGRVTLLAVLVFLLILELAVRRKATRKRPLS